MRDDLVVPGEHEENFVLAKDARVVTVPFTPLDGRPCQIERELGRRQFQTLDQ